jgi:hypothetical protein
MSREMWLILILFLIVLVWEWVRLTKLIKLRKWALKVTTWIHVAHQIIKWEPDEPEEPTEEDIPKFP